MALELFADTGTLGELERQNERVVALLRKQLELTSRINQTRSIGASGGRMTGGGVAMRMGGAGGGVGMNGLDVNEVRDGFDASKLRVRSFRRFGRNIEHTIMGAVFINDLIARGGDDMTPRDVLLGGRFAQNAVREAARLVGTSNLLGKGLGLLAGGAGTAALLGFAAHAEYEAGRAGIAREWKTKNERRAILQDTGLDANVQKRLEQFAEEQTLSKASWLDRQGGFEPDEYSVIGQIKGIGKGLLRTLGIMKRPEEMNEELTKKVKEDVEFLDNEEKRASHAAREGNLAEVGRLDAEIVKRFGPKTGKAILAPYGSPVERYLKWDAALTAHKMWAATQRARGGNRTADPPLPLN